MLNLFKLTYSEMVAVMKKRYGRGAYHAAAVIREVHREGNLDLSKAAAFNHSPGLLERLKADMKIEMPSVVKVQHDGKLLKFVSRLSDGLDVEAVVVPMANHKTLCISSQIGCRMGCVFCETGQMGLLRNLGVEEIVGQVFAARFFLHEDIQNVVFMGMGEPFDNFENVVQSIRVLSDQRGFNIARRHITVSTAGLDEGIRRLASLGWQDIKLAVSLNAPNDDIRSKIMPLNRRVPLGKLKAALLEYPLGKNGTFFIEYVLIKGVNNERRHAKELARFLKPLEAKLNLIPYNPRTDTPFEPPAAEDVQNFLDWMIEEKVFVRKRTTRGLTVQGACGQLASLKRPPSVSPVNGSGFLPDENAFNRIKEISHVLP